MIRCVKSEVNPDASAPEFSYQRGDNAASFRWRAIVPLALLLAINLLNYVDRSVLSAVVEGTRPMLIEVQALTTKSVFGYPKRTASGFDLNRLNLLLAVLQRRAGVDVSEQDVFVNIVERLGPAKMLAAQRSAHEPFQRGAVAPGTNAFKNLLRA